MDLDAQPNVILYASKARLRGIVRRLIYMSHRVNPEGPSTRATGLIPVRVRFTIRIEMSFRPVYTIAPSRADSRPLGVIRVGDVGVLFLLAVVHVFNVPLLNMAR